MLGIPLDGRRLIGLLALALVVAGCDRDTLAGTWQPAPADAPADAPAARYTFFADGRARIVTQPAGAEAEVYEARYETSGDTLLTLSDTQGAERFRMRLTADTLWLQSPVTGQDTRLVRVVTE